MKKQTVIHLGSLENYKTLMVFLDKEGWRWFGTEAATLTSEVSYEYYKREKECCICLEGKDKCVTYCGLPYFHSSPDLYDILEFDEFMRIHNPIPNLNHRLIQSIEDLMSK